MSAAGASRRARFKQSDATRALKAAQRAGLQPSGYKIDTSGAIIVMLNGGTDSPEGNRNPWDDEFLP
jgi:hypothetical protein